MLKEIIRKKLVTQIINAIGAKYDLNLNEDYVIYKTAVEDNILPFEREVGIRLQNLFGPISIRFYK